MKAYESLSAEQRDKLMVEVRRSAKEVPKHTVLSYFEPEIMGSITLSMSDYAALLTVSLTVLEYGMHAQTICTHAVTTLRALKALRQFLLLLNRPTISSDGEQAVRKRSTVVELQRLGENLMIEIRRLLPFNEKWERPPVHRLLELLHRTLLPLVQLGSAKCELILENFHQMAKREVSQCNHRNAAEYSMQWWRDTEQYSKGALHARGAWHPSVVAAFPGRKSVEGRLVPQTRSAAAVGIYHRRRLARQGSNENRLYLDRGALEGSCTQRAHHVLEESQAPAEVSPHSRGVDGVSDPRRRAI